jgi:hypothetical protein
MHENGSLPRARQDGLLVETVGEELLLYDQTNHTAHCLSPIAAGVWRHCDGERDVTELAGLAGVSESLVAAALRELREKDLLDAEPQLLQGAASGISRREAVGRIARYGAAAAAAPLIVSATAATPAMASSEEIFKEGEGQKCTAKGANTPNCCLCKDACGDGTMTGTPSEAGCKTACKEKYGGFISWAKEAECA